MDPSAEYDEIDRKNKAALEYFLSTSLNNQDKLLGWYISLTYKPDNDEILSTSEGRGTIIEGTVLDGLNRLKLLEEMKSHEGQIIPASDYQKKKYAET